MSKGTKASRDGILVDRVYVLVRILKLAFCHTYLSNQVVLEGDEGSPTDSKGATVAGLGPGRATKERN
jgi:hypothetical protein